MYDIMLILSLSRAALNLTHFLLHRQKKIYCECDKKRFLVSSHYATDAKESASDFYLHCTVPDAGGFNPNTESIAAAD